MCPEPLEETAARPRVAIVAHAIDRFGGMDRALTELITRGADRFEFVVVSSTLADELKPHVEWQRIRAPARPMPLKFLFFFLAAGARLARMRFDLVSTLGAIVPNRVDVVSVHYCHAGDQQVNGRVAPAGASLSRRANSTFTGVLSAWAERWCYRPRRARLLTAVSVGVKRELNEYFPEVPVTVVPNGVDTLRFAPDEADRARIRSELGVQPDDLVVLFVGGDWERKGLAVVLDAISLLEQNGEASVRLWVVGSGDERRFSRIAAEAGIAELVAFLGPRRETERFFQGADVFLLPTRYEALPLVLLEALATCVPIIVTRVNGVEELFEDAVPGVVIERDAESVAEALIRFRGDPASRKEMGRAGRRVAEQYTWERSARETLDLYEGLLAVPGGQGVPA